jgi:hypothetical protein
MEHLVGKLFEKKGYNVKVTQKTGDFGIDVEAKNATEFIGIQVKHWKNDVGFEDCAKTLGVSHKYNKAIIISTKSGFTPQAWKFQEENQYRLELWDTQRFRQELERFNITPNSIRHHLTMVRDEKTNFVHSSGIENNKKTNLPKTVKYGLGSMFLGLFLLIMAESVDSFVFWGGLTFFIIGMILLIVSLFWKVAGWASAKMESNTTTYTLSKDENNRKGKNELIKYILLLVVVLIMLGIIW